MNLLYYAFAALKHTWSYISSDILRGVAPLVLRFHIVWPNFEELKEEHGPHVFVPIPLFCGSPYAHKVSPLVYALASLFNPYIDREVFQNVWILWMTSIPGEHTLMIKDL